MRRRLEIAFLVALVAGCGKPSGSGPVAKPVAEQPKSPSVESPVIANDLPLLRFTRQDGEDALLGYKLTDAEKKLFKEMDAAVVALPADSPLEVHHDAASRVGAKHGLTRSQSIAFWTRATFSMFEP